MAMTTAERVRRHREAQRAELEALRVEVQQLRQRLADVEGSAPRRRPLGDGGGSTAYGADLIAQARTLKAQGMSNRAIAAAMTAAGQAVSASWVQKVTASK